MSKIDLENLTIQTAHDHLVKGDFSVADLVGAYKKRIEEKNPEINAYLEVFDDLEEQTAAAQKKIDGGKADVLTGIPLAVKDNILIQGRIASASSKILEHYRAPYDATVISKLKEKGAVLLGRTNMDEFAMGSSTENSAFGVTKNPHDSARVSGGSSGGSAAAVAMDGALGALGSETGGSIRQPAAFCGTVGLKTTYGSVSRFGLMAMGSSLDQIGPVTKSVTDAEIIFNAIRGKDSRDSTSIESGKHELPKKFTVGVPKNLTEEKGLDPDVVKNFEDAVLRLKSLGVETIPIDMPEMSQALAVYYIIMPAEVSSNLARFDGVKYGSLKEKGNLLEDYFHTRGEYFGKEARRRIILGTYVLSSGYYDAYYNKAHIVRTLMQKEFKKIFEKVDAVITPTTPTPAFKIGEKMDDPLSMYLADIFTVTANIIGAPALSVPSGFADLSGSKLPLGLQFMAAHGREDILFALGKKFLAEESL